MMSCHTWTLVRALGDVGSDSDVDKVGVLGSSWGLEQSSSASDVISGRTREPGQIPVIVGTGLGIREGKKKRKAT